MSWFTQLRLAGSFLLVVAAGWSLWHSGGSLAPPRTFLALPFAAAALLQWGTSWANTWLAHRQLRGMGMDTRFRALWRVNLWGSLLNLLLPFGLGLLLRGAWLRRVHGASALQVGRHLAVTNVVMFGVNLWYLAAALVWLARDRWWPLLPLAAVALGAIAYRRLRPLLLPCLLPYPFIAAGLALSAAALGIALAAPVVLLLPLSLQLSALVVLAPGSLGVTESLLVLIGRPFGVSETDALWAALALRTAGLAGAAWGLAALAVWGMRADRQLPQRPSSDRR